MEGTQAGPCWPPPRPLLAASARPRAGVLLAGCAVLVVVLGALFAHQSAADTFDRAVDAPVISWFAARDGLALRLAYPGTMLPAAALSLIIAIACLIAAQGCRAGRGGRPGRRRAVRGTDQAPGPPHLHRPGRLPERAHRGHLRAGGHGHRAAARARSAGHAGCGS